jgi:hypothetical protein
MCICIVNGLECEAQTGLETWGQLLDALERGDGPERAIVTAVRFEGVDEPSFRDASVLTRDLGTAHGVDVDTCAAGDLVASAIETAREGLGPLAVAARQTADAFRSHDLPRAHRGLADFVLTLQTLTRLTAAVNHMGRTCAAVDPEAQGTEVLECLRVGLESLVALNMSQDWISVADVLEYEMAELLPRWNEMLYAIGQSHGAQGVGAGARSAEFQGSVSCHTNTINFARA